MALQFVQRYKKYLTVLVLVLLYVVVYVCGTWESSTRLRITAPEWDSIPIAARLSSTIEPRCLLDINKLGVVHLDKSPQAFSQIEAANQVVASGGRWAPKNCTPRQHIAILIPYRDRLMHLKLLIKRLHPMLRRQKASYQIFVIEQAGNDVYNKGMLFNIGINEALRQLPFDCFIFHDVDLLPENDKNIYFCDDNLRHFSSAIDEWRYTLMYSDNAGGVVSLNYENVLKVNGYSNMYWGWGAEDDDFSSRCLEAGLLLTRPPQHIGRYSMVRHAKRFRANNAYNLLFNWKLRWKTDGLNSIEKTNYTIVRREMYPLYTWVLVNVGKPPTIKELFLPNVAVVQRWMAH